LRYLKNTEFISLQYISIKPFLIQQQFPQKFDFREEAQLQLLKELSTYSDELDNIPENKPPGKIEYYFNNGMFGPMDAFVYYCMIRKFSPTKIIEVGSGFSTLIASKAATRNNGGQIISIEPYPREFLKKGLPYMTELIPTPVQKVPLENFKILKKDDILFIDSSHVSKINSDVNYLYLHVIPELNPGVIIHIHDFFLPFEYPREWIMKQKRFWNELYLVWAFLIGNSKYEILMANHFLTRLHRTEVDTSFSTISKFGGGSGSLWLRKI